ncbi:hypothetical protein NBRC116493_10160 [Aurantivibrio infirmus]
MEQLRCVKIETTKLNDNVWGYKGQILKAVFEGIVSNQLNAGYFKLDNVYWVSANYDDNGDEKEDQLFQFGKGKLNAYEGSLYLKIEHLVSIAPINGELELAKFNKDKVAYLNLVTPTCR